MPRLTRRTQLLLDDERYAQLEQRAAQTGRSIASIIREAIDDKLAQQGAARRREAAGRAFLAAPAPSGSEPDWDDVKGDLADARYRKAHGDGGEA